MNDRLYVVHKHEESYGIRTELVQRAARIDALGVDRSRLPTVLQRWSPEAEAREESLTARRVDVTLADRIEAWRQFFRLTEQP